MAYLTLGDVVQVARDRISLQERIMPDSIGELKLCQEGQRLYDEYCRLYDDKVYSDNDMLDAWDAYYNHRMECSDCGYR